MMDEERYVDTKLFISCEYLPSGHNVIPDGRVLLSNICEIAGHFWDVVIASYLSINDYETF